MFPIDAIMIPPPTGNSISHVSAAKIIPDHNTKDGACCIIGGLLLVVHTRCQADNTMTICGNSQRLTQQCMVEKSYTRMFVFSDPTAPKKCSLCSNHQIATTTNCMGKLLCQPIVSRYWKLFLDSQASSHAEHTTKGGGLMVVSTRFPITPIACNPVALLLVTPSLTTFYQPPSQAEKI
jgi:hypothetical protein